MQIQCMIPLNLGRIPPVRDRLLPFLADVRGYTSGAFRADLLAGLAVAVFAIPQAMAYAMLAGVAPVYGLYAAVVMSIVAALWGSSPYVNTGPTNSAALLTAAALLPLAPLDNPMPVVATLCLLVGAIRLVMGLARLGRLLDFVPESAFLGFTVGAGLLIAMGQLHHFLGVLPPESAWFPARMAETAARAGETDPAALLIGLGTLVIMLGLNHRFRVFPVALVAIGLAALAAWLLHDRHPVRIVADIAAIPRGLPVFAPPLLDADLVRALLPAAFAISVIGLIEAASIGQTLALRNNQRLDVNQEFVGQGLSHLAGAFLSAIPGSGSFSRSLLIETSGGKTRLANVFFGVATLGAMLAVPHLLEWIPVSALSGLLIYIGIRLVDVPRLRRVLATSVSDSIIMVLTFGVTVFYRIEYGIFVGVAGAALVHLHRARELQLVEYQPDDSGRVTEKPCRRPEDTVPGDVVALGVSGDLFYGISSALRDQLDQVIEERHPRHLILRMRRAYSIDYSCWSVLFDLAAHLEQLGGRLYLCGIRPDFEPIVRQAGLGNPLTPERLYPATASPFEAFDRCLDAVLADPQLEGPTAARWRRYRAGHHPSPPAP